MVNVNTSAVGVLGCTQGCEYPVCLLGDKCVFDFDKEDSEIIAPAKDDFMNKPVE